MKYYEEVLELYDTKFTIKQMKPAKRLAFATMEMKQKEFNLITEEDLIQAALEYIQVERGPGDWGPIINSNGSSRIDLLDEKPGSSFKIYTWFRMKVIVPVFQD